MKLANLHSSIFFVLLTCVFSCTTRNGSRNENAVLKKCNILPDLGMDKSVLGENCLSKFELEPMFTDYYSPTPFSAYNLESNDIFFTLIIDSATNKINYISCFDENFVTENGVRVGMTIKEIKSFVPESKYELQYAQNSFGYLKFSDEWIGRFNYYEPMSDTTRIISFYKR